MISIFSILLGYLIGTILPAYYFGRLKGIDIRHEGAEYAGTINVYHVIGPRYAILTCIIDLTKGIFAIKMALLFGVNFHIAQLSGLAAVAGHVLPFYLDFRGGQGVACATGILLYYLAHFLSTGALQIHVLLYLAIIVVIFAYVVRHGELISVIILPLIFYSIGITRPEDPLNLYLLFVVLYIMAVGVHNIVTRKLLIIEEESFRKSFWRVLLRPGATFFVLYYFYHTKRETLFLVGTVALIFLIIDIDRLSRLSLIRTLLKKELTIFKPSEEKRLSSLTLFLVGSFLTIWLFNQMIAITAMLMLIFGDIFSKIFGMAYGRHPLFKKTLEGSLAFLGCGLICIFILSTALSWSPTLMLVGVIAASIAEILPLGIDDNLTIPLLSGFFMWIARYLGAANSF